MAPRAEAEDFVNGYDALPPKTAAEVSIDMMMSLRQSGFEDSPSICSFFTLIAKP